MSPEVSIIVPVYNIEPYLTDCVESLIGQSFADIEIVLVDDGSTDSSGYLCDSLAARDPRILTIHKSNGGLSSARNAGIRVASGRYVTFVDGDDWVDLGMIEGMLDVAHSTGAGIVIAGFRRVHNHGAAAHTHPRGFRIELMTPREALSELVMGDQRVTMVIACAKLYERSYWQQIEFPLGRLHEDEYAAHRVFAVAGLVARTAWAPYYYRQRPGSIMDSRGPRSRRDALDAIKGRAQFLASLGMPTLARATSARAFGIWRQQVAYGDFSGRRETLKTYVDLSLEIIRSGFPLWAALKNLPWAVAADLADRIANRLGVATVRGGKE